MSDVSELGEQLSEVATHIGGIEVKPFDPNEVVDEQLLNWYESRFKMLKEDGVPDAITYYIEHVSKQDVNDITKATVIQRALEYTM